MSEAKQRVLRHDDEAGRPERRVDDRNLHRYGVWLGWVLLLGSVLNLVMLWWSPRFGLAEWEFTTVTQTVNFMPLLLIGLVLVTVGALLDDRSGLARGLAVVYGLITLGLIGLTVLLALSSMTGWGQMVQQQVADEGKVLFVRAVLKNGLLLGSYLVFFVAVAVSVWRRTRR